MGVGHNGKPFGFVMTDENHTVNETFIGSYVHSLKTLMYLFHGGSEGWRKDLKEHTLKLYETVYKKHLKIAEYCIHPNFPDKIILFYHAPVGLRTLDQISCDLFMFDNTNDINFNYETPEKLGETIDKINQAFSKLIYKDKWFDQVFPFNLHESHVVHANAFGRICWVRWDPEMMENLNIVYDGMFGSTPDHKIDYDAIVIHGHDYYVSPKLSDKVFSLDHVLGQFMTCFKPDADQGSLPLFLL